MSWQKIRQQVLERDGYTCQICLKKVEKLAVNHVIRQRLQGLDSLYNLFTVCRTCHDLVELRPPPKIVKYKVVIFKDDPPEIKKLKQIAIDDNIIVYIDCGCGCGSTRLKYNEKGKVMRFINGHQNRGVNNPSYKKSGNEIFIKLPKLNQSLLNVNVDLLNLSIVSVDVVKRYQNTE